MKCLWVSEGSCLKTRWCFVRIWVMRMLYDKWTIKIWKKMLKSHIFGLVSIIFLYTLSRNPPDFLQIRTSSGVCQELNKWQCLNLISTHNLTMKQTTEDSYATQSKDQLARSQRQRKCAPIQSFDFYSDQYGSIISNPFCTVNKLLSAPMLWNMTALRLTTALKYENIGKLHGILAILK